MVLDLKTKRGMGKSCTICKTPDKEWAWVETDHLPPYEPAWHWLTRQMVQRISVVLGKKAKSNTSKGITVFRKISNGMSRSI